LENPRATLAAQVGVADRVTFADGHRTLAGHVARKGRLYALVVTDNGAEFRVPYTRLSPVVGASKQHVEAHTDQLRARFHAGDRVRFVVGPETLDGVISRLNPVYAHVVCDDDREYRVPYAQLHALEGQAAAGPGPAQRTGPELASIAARARSWIAAHRLQHWSFQFDHATKRAGCCTYSDRVISLAYSYAQCAPNQEIADTILHEIAHALVGKTHGHDAVWRAKALAIGCSGQRCHDVQFTPPRYIVRCEHGCWVTTAERRKQQAMCSRCHGRVLYATYTEERWHRARAESS
jgi:predicted SprT family Zn-dependent metalloprotease